MDSDDQNFNKKCDIDDDDDDVLVEYKVDTKCCDKINGIEGSQYLDANGNTVNGDNQSSKNNEYDECDCVGVEIDSQVKSTLSESNEVHKKNDSVMKKLMALALDDYGEKTRKHDSLDAFLAFFVVSIDAFIKGIPDFDFFVKS